jgi:hypothetical protein
MKQMNIHDVWFKDFPEQEQIKEIQKIGKEIFSTPNGAIFLTILLDDLCYTRRTSDEGENALRSYATFLLRERLGVTNDSLAVTTALLNIEPKEPING